MATSVWNLFVEVDKTLGGDGDPVQIASDVLKIRKSTHPEPSLSLERIAMLKSFLADAQQGIHPGYIFAWDLANRARIFSSRDALADVLGHEPVSEDRIFETFMHFVHPEDLTTISTIMDELATQNQTVTRYRVRNADDDYTWFESITKCFTRDAQGSPTVIAGYYQVLDNVVM